MSERLTHDERCENGGVGTYTVNGCDCALRDVQRLTALTEAQAREIERLERQVNASVAKETYVALMKEGM